MKILFTTVVSLFFVFKNSLLGFEPILQDTTGELNYIGECRDGLTGRCDECQGDCDEDADCMAGLVCFQRENGESIPGCAGGSVFDVKDKDYCTYLIALYYISYNPIASFS